ncbi:MAG: hypothetical protein GY711_10085 [bacterium]|nr:hypothetical protein [bacterium]
MSTATTIPRGEIDGLDAALLPFFEDYDTADADPRLAEVTLEDLLTMRTGIAWREGASDATDTTLQLEMSADIFSPPLVVSHNSDSRLFELGEASSPALAQLAEEGDNSVLARTVDSDFNVRDFRSNGPPIMPGQSASIMVIADDVHTQLSLASMLVSTNDAFTAVRNLTVPTDGSATVLARAYDAGSEANSEDCAFIPGPPCGASGAHDPALAEGHVHIHAGVHGIGSIDASLRDWRDAVAEVKVELFTN